MSLTIASLNSGSNGNCYYLASQNDAVFIDAGISCRETERRMIRLGLNIRNIKAIFISHEHSDHIKGVEVLSRKYDLPVYITEKTYRNSRMKLSSGAMFPFAAYETISIGGLDVTAFPKLHDAAEPHSFVVSSNGVKAGVFTDIGQPCEHVVQHFSTCHAAFLESNYDEKMLSEGHYPYHLKQRIRSEKGHLSNDQALDLFLKHRPAYMNCLLLSHLSKDNNDPEIVQDLFRQHCGSTQIEIASRDGESKVFRIDAAVELSKNVHAIASRQISLF